MNRAPTVVRIMGRADIPRRVEHGPRGYPRSCGSRAVRLSRVKWISGVVWISRAVWIPARADIPRRVDIPRHAPVHDSLGG